MLTGDNALTAAAIAAQVGIDRAYGDQLPQDKLAAVEKRHLAHRNDFHALKGYYKNFAIDLTAGNEFMHSLELVRNDYNAQFYLKQLLDTGEQAGCLRMTMLCHIARRPLVALVLIVVAVLGVAIYAAAANTASVTKQPIPSQRATSQSLSRVGNMGGKK